MGSRLRSLLMTKDLSLWLLHKIFYPLLVDREQANRAASNGCYRKKSSMRFYQRQHGPQGHCHPGDQVIRSDAEGERKYTYTDTRSCNGLAIPEKGSVRLIADTMPLAASMLSTC